MPPKRKCSVGLDGSDTEGAHSSMLVHEGESAVPKKRGRKSIIDSILQEEARATPAPVLPQNQWTVSIIQPQDVTPTTNAAKRRKVQPTAPSPTKPKYPSPGTPSIWAANKGDFYFAFKSLTESFGGISFANLGTFPVLAWLVECPRSAEDTMEGDILHLSLVTEFKPKEQQSTSTLSAGPKKKGGQKRRTKREDINSVSTALGNAANTIVPSNTHMGGDSPFQDTKPAPQKPWPRLVRSPVYNPDYPTFCECLQPGCPNHSPAARDILLRGCTTFSWPRPGVMGLSDWPLLVEPHGDVDAGVRGWHAGDLSDGPGGSSEHNPRIQVNGSSSSAPTFSSRLPLSTAKMYAQVVPELASLLDHMERKDPILVISATDASMDPILPFQLPPEYGCIVMGFFNVESVECESDFSSPTTSIQPGKLSWKVRLRYESPSNATDTSGNLAPPWWLPSPVASAVPDAAVPPPLPPVPEPEKNDVEGEMGGQKEAPPSIDVRWCIIQALDGNKRRSWWHCSGCGKINQKDMLIHRRCSSCKRNEDPASLFTIEDVLQDTSIVPYPFNHAPRSMKPADISVKEFPGTTSAYCYNFHTELPPVETSTNPGPEKRACVKHVFTGPYGDLKTQATEVFYQIQGDLELMWQSVSTGVADGPYYCWASPRHGWVDDEIPRCIHQARKHILRSVTNYARKDPGGEGALNPPLLAVSAEAGGKGGDATEEDRINHVVVLAWTASGSKRGTFVSAKESPVFILCLGAPVELDLERWLPDLSESAAAVNAESDPPVNGGAVVSGAVDGDGEAAEKTKGRKPRKSKAAVPEPASGAGVDSKGNKKAKEKVVVTQPKPKPIALPHEKLKINMVHGDVLILEGGDFIYTLSRSGMSILVLALPNAQY